MFDPKGDGVSKKMFFVKKNNSFSFQVFFAFYAISNIFREKTNFLGGGGGGVEGRVVLFVLVSEPVSGRPRVTELPCFSLNCPL